MNARGAAVELRDVRKAFGGHAALRGIDLVIPAGQVVCVFGPSGCGKSTLLRCINFLAEPDQGVVLINRTPMGRIPVGGRFRRDSERNIDRMRSEIGIVFQQFNLWPHRTALENVADPLVVVRGLSRRDAAAQALEMLVRVGMADFAHRFPARLSGGQQQRTAIARALAMEPKVLLFDEPTSSLDPELVHEVLAAIRSVSREGATTIIVTHHLGFAREVADRLIFMDAGQILEDGPPAAVLDAPRAERLRSFLSLVLPSSAG